LKINETVISIADETIPKTSTNPKHPGKPWFNDECKDAIKNRKKAERRPILFQCSSSFRPEDAKIAEVVRSWMFSEPSFGLFAIFDGIFALIIKPAKFCF
jgi:hypothetical protein